MKLQVVIDGVTYEVEIADINARPVVATVDGERFEVWPEAPAASAAALGVASAPATPAVAPATTAAPATGARPSAPSSGNGVESGVILAPIPGVVLSVKVKPGERVTVGQEVCVLEAMKMQNSIRARQAGIIAVVHVADGQHVKHHQPLLVIQPE